MGNRANIFSKIGDSITANPWTLYPIGWGTYDLGEYSHLQPVLNYFIAENARDGNSFRNVPLAAEPGWTSGTVLDSDYANSEICQPGESPLHCEYRVVRPSVALIMLGTNDLPLTSGDQYRANMRQIVQTSIDMGVIPVLSTIPNRYGFDVPLFNSIITETARSYDIPLWHYWSAMQNLPATGLEGDQVHPSYPPGEYAEAAYFRPDTLQYGYTLRNLSALQVLDAVWRQVILGG